MPCHANCSPTAAPYPFPSLTLFIHINVINFYFMYSGRPDRAHKWAQAWLDLYACRPMWITRDNTISQSWASREISISCAHNEWHTLLRPQDGRHLSLVVAKHCTAGPDEANGG